MGVRSKTAKRLADSTGGKAPHYSCRGWCRLDMVAQVALASKNVAVTVDNGVGNWSIGWRDDVGDNGADLAYATQVTVARGAPVSGAEAINYANTGANPNQGTTTQVFTTGAGGSAADYADVSVCIFR